MPGPVFQNITPAPASSIDPATAISFDIVSDGVHALVLVVPIVAVDPNVAGELLHDWTLNAFSPAYVKNSSRTVITNGFRYTFRRLNGWAAPPVLRAWAVDTAGNVTAL